jgi:glutathione S-transferase
LAGALETVSTELGLLEDVLAESDYLVGARASAADIVYYPTVHRLLRAASKPVAQEHGLSATPLQTYPAISAWLERMRLKPGVDETYPPHWR